VLHSIGSWNYSLLLTYALQGNCSKIRPIHIQWTTLYVSASVNSLNSFKAFFSVLLLKIAADRLSVRRLDQS